MRADRSAVFLDRDGTLIEDVGYLSRPSQVRVLPGVPEGLASLREAGHLLVVTTNQSGIGRGMYTEDDFERVTKRITEELGIEFDLVLHCPHSPEAECPCRKPAPGMLLRAAKRLGIDFFRSWAVGDRERDLLAGLALGCRGVYLGDGPCPPGAKRARDFEGAVAAVLSEAG